MQPATPTARIALLWTAASLLLTLGAVLTRDRTPIALPVADETGTSAGQA